MKKGKELYGKRVCKKCCYGFVNRRQGAFLIDIILLRLLSGALGAALIFLAVSINIGPNTYFVLTWGLTVLTWLIFVLKDGIGGLSPGKAMTGVQAVDKGTLEPIGFATSLKRNLPLLIPFAPLVAAFQMVKGGRLGDKWSNTRIIWRKHKGNPVFTGAALPEVVDDYLPGQPMPNRPQSDNPFAAPIE